MSSVVGTLVQKIFGSCVGLKADRRRWDVVPQYVFDHIFLDRSPQSLPHEFSDAQISQHCDKRKLAESMRPEWEISSYLFASILRYYRNLRRTRGKDFLGLLLSLVSDRSLKRNNRPGGIAQAGGWPLCKIFRRKLMPNLEHVTWSDPTVTPSNPAISSRLVDRI